MTVSPPALPGEIARRARGGKRARLGWFAVLPPPRHAFGDRRAPSPAFAGEAM
jgi:hypothetical protein